MEQNGKLLCKDLCQAPLWNSLTFSYFRCRSIEGILCKQFSALATLLYVDWLPQANGPPWTLLSNSANHSNKCQHSLLANSSNLKSQQDSFDRPASASEYSIVEQSDSFWGGKHPCFPYLPVITREAAVSRKAWPRVEIFHFPHFASLGLRHFVVAENEKYNPVLDTDGSLVIHNLRLFSQASMWSVIRPQIKQASSRAMAVFAILCFFPCCIIW